MFSKTGSAFVHRALIERGHTLAVAESLTSGRLQSLIGARSGASKYFRGGVTTYTIPVKAALLDVDEEAAAKCDAVSPEIAQQMAEGVCRLFGSDYGVATTGYAEPYPEQSVTAPHAYVAVYSAITKSVVSCDLFRGSGLNREKMQTKTAQFAMEALERALKQAGKEQFSPARADATPHPPESSTARHYGFGPNGYSLNGAPFANLASLTGARRAVKRPISLSVLQVDAPFDLTGPDDVDQGKPGDWLIEGVAGELYICPSEVFSASYDCIAEEKS